MPVQVMHFLPAFSAGVGENAKTTLGVGLAALLQGQARRQRHHAPEQGFVLGAHLSHGSNVLARDHQKMHRCPRVDVVKGKNVFVFVDLAAGNLAGGNLAKNTVVGGVHGLAHITGGGITENPPRILPEGLACEIDLGAWELPPVFRWLATTANMSESELLKTFNCGIGMMLAVAPDQAQAVADVLAAEGEMVVDMGQIIAGQGVVYRGKLL